jgi:hypothetical protein
MLPFFENLSEWKQSCESAHLPVQKRISIMLVLKAELLHQNADRALLKFHHLAHLASLLSNDHGMILSAQEKSPIARMLMDQIPEMKEESLLWSFIIDEDLSQFNHSAINIYNDEQDEFAPLKDQLGKLFIY